MTRIKNLQTKNCIALQSTNVKTLRKCYNRSNLQLCNDSFLIQVSPEWHGLKG
jgi:hypothetical protein